MKIAQMRRWMLYGMLCFLLLSCAMMSDIPEKGIVSSSDPSQPEKAKVLDQIEKDVHLVKKGPEKTAVKTDLSPKKESTRVVQQPSSKPIAKKKTVRKTPPKKTIPQKTIPKKQIRTEVKPKKKIKKNSQKQTVKKSSAKKSVVNDKPGGTDHTVKKESVVVEKKPVAKIEPEIDNVTELTTLCVPQYPRKKITILDVVNLQRDVEHFGRDVLRNLKGELAKDHDLVEDVQIKIVLNVHSYTLQGLLKDQLQIIDGNIETDLIIFGIDLFDNSLDGILILFVRTEDASSSCYKWFIKETDQYQNIDDIDRTAFQEQLILLAQNDLPSFIRTIKVLYVVGKIRKSSPHLFNVLTSPEDSALFQKFKRRNPGFSEEMLKLKNELNDVIRTVPGYMDEIKKLKS